MIKIEQLLHEEIAKCQLYNHYCRTIDDKNYCVFNILFSDYNLKNVKCPYRGNELDEYNRDVYFCKKEKGGDK